MKQRILYIFLGGNFTSNESGVLKKVIAKVAALNTNETTCHCISLSDEIKEEKNYNQFIKIIPYQNTVIGKYFRTFKAEWLLYKNLINWLKENSKNYDVILFRYPMASWGLLQLVRAFPNKVIFEHNTKEKEELDLELVKRKKSIPFSFKPGYFIYLIEIVYLPWFFEKYVAPKIFKKAKMGIAVTNEIATYETERCSTYLTKVITNGIDVGSCKLHSQNPLDNNLKLFMLIGYAAPWHGIPRLVQSLENYKGSVNITIDIIGSLTKDDLSAIENSKVKSQFNIIPPLPFNELDAVLNNYHAGIGSLATFEKGILEASPLKVREYFARGFPCIIGYKDTDLMNVKEFSPYYFEVAADNSLIDFDKVIEFVKRVYSITSHPSIIKALAEKYLDTKVKMKSLIDLLMHNPLKSAA